MLARRVGLATLLTAIAAVSATRAQDSKGKLGDGPSSVDAATLKAGEYPGKLLSPPDGSGLFTLRIENLEAKDPAAAARATGQLNSDIQRAAQLEQQVAINATQKQVNALKQLYDKIRSQQNKMRDLYNPRDVEFHAADDMMVRFLRPPVQYDDKGERKKLSLIDLKELRGVDPNVPGYRGQLSDLQPNQIVRVTLAEVKASKEKGKTGPKMEATLALIVVAEDTTPVPQDRRDTGKKKGK
jgi:hypothetical protein